MKHQMKAEVLLHLDDHFGFDFENVEVFGVPVERLSIDLAITVLGSRLVVTATTTGKKKRKALSRAFREQNFPQVTP